MTQIGRSSPTQGGPNHRIHANELPRPAGRQSKETHHMRPSHPSIVLAGSLVVFSAMQAVADQLCKPVLSLRDVRISEPRNMQRHRCVALLPKAPICSPTSGPFEIKFTHLNETAPALRFTE